MIQKKRIRKVVCLFVVCVVSFVASRQFAEEKAALAPASVKTSEPTLKDKLKKLSELVIKKDKILENGGTDSVEEFQELDAEFRKLVQANAADFTKTKVLQQSETNHFNKITLNKLGAGFDAIRFKNESAEAKDMVWMFATPKKSSMSMWYITPASGEMRGFSNFFNGTSTYKGAPWAESKEPYSTTFQSLVGARIQPGAEYILWFTFTDPHPEDFYVAINLVPVNTFIHGLYAQEINMGLRKWPKDEEKQEQKKPIEK